MNKITHISLITENLFEVKGKTSNIVQIVNPNSVTFEVNMTKVYFTNPIMDKVADLESVLMLEDIVAVRYWMEDGSMVLARLENLEGKSQIRHQTKILINVTCDVDNLKN